MVIVDQEILYRMQTGWDNYDVTMVQPASVDLRLFLKNEKVLEPWTSDLLSTVEWMDLGPRVNLPPVAGLVTLKTSAFRMGLALAGAGWVDPGYIGNLTVRLINVVTEPITLRPDTPLFQLIQFRTFDIPHKLYAGHYMRSVGVVENRNVELG